MRKDLSDGCIDDIDMVIVLMMLMTLLILPMLLMELRCDCGDVCSNE